MPIKSSTIFHPDIPPDLEHASALREEGLDWLERRFPNTNVFKAADVLSMSGESSRRWLIGRLREHGIGTKNDFSLPDAADALTVLFLRSKGVKFRDAIDAVAGNKTAEKTPEARYGGMWNRLIYASLERLERLLPARLLAGLVFAIVRAEDRCNCMIIVKRKAAGGKAPQKPWRVSHDYVYHSILERPAPACAVISPTCEAVLCREQLPARSEVTSRYFSAVRIQTEQDQYELLIGTMKPSNFTDNEATLSLVGRILDIVFVDLGLFLSEQSSGRLDAPVEPEPASASDLQLWLVTQFLSSIYPGSLCEIIETSPTTHITKVLASSVSKPWEPSLWEPAKSLEMLSGYVSRTGVPLVVENVEYPWTLIIEGIDSELRFLRSKAGNNSQKLPISAMALPITSGSGNCIGSIYVLAPRSSRVNLDIEVRILSVFSQIIGEIIERHRATVYSAEAMADAVSLNILKPEQFSTALNQLLSRKAEEVRQNEPRGRDIRLPILLVAAHSPEPQQFDPGVALQLKTWLADSLRHLEWRSFVRSHWWGAREGLKPDGFIGEVPGIGVMIPLGNLVSKDELDQIRSAFPTTINQTSPINSPAKLVSWVLDVPAQRILDEANAGTLSNLASEIETWAFDVATVVHDLALSSVLAHEKGEWEAALKIIRRALAKPGNKRYLLRLAADCSMSLGDWPGALKYAHEAVELKGKEPGSGHVRSFCLEADAHLCLGNPLKAWDLYTEAASRSRFHPLPLYYRGQSLLLMARLLRTYEDECRLTSGLDSETESQAESVLKILVDGALEDLTSAADLLDRWGLIPESYQYKNFHLVPTLIGQSLSYLLANLPGPAASRLQIAHRAFPKDDLFFREYLFAKCWEQGIHRQYAKLLLSDTWTKLLDRIKKA